MFDFKPEKRIEPISSLADIQRLEKIIELKRDGTFDIDGWYLETFVYKTGHGMITGHAVFQKIIHVGPLKADISIEPPDPLIELDRVVALDMVRRRWGRGLE